MAMINYPGIYIEEKKSAIISAGMAPATVPAFAISNNQNINNYNRFNKAKKIVSWEDWLTKKGSQSLNFIEDRALRVYFDNGGGPCYAISTGHLTEQVPLHDDITLLVGAGQDIRTHVAALCQDGKGLFAIMDGPATEIEPDYIPSGTYSSNPHAAVYYPYLTSKWTGGLIPASAAIAAIYCCADRTRGVWKAPANIAIKGDVWPQFKVTDDIAGRFNQGLAINMIRVLDHRGPVVYSARTLEDSDNWRYISVRRLFDSVERDIARVMKTLILEPNNPFTWEKARTAIDNYLHRLWTQGGLAGATEKDAYCVQIGAGVTMSADDVDQGRMIVRISMAPMRPAEFIVLQFSQNVAQV